VISGPSTLTHSIGKGLHGIVQGVTTGAALAEATQCLTDTFSVTNAESLPTICGLNSGYHVYFDARDECHSLDFQLGNVAQGIPNAATRSWSIKVSQYACDYENLAPSGCDQYHFASDASNYLRTFNFQQGTGSGKHLANQHQSICIRRETGMCRICYSVDDKTKDIGLTGKVAGKAGVAGTKCCAYGLAGAGDDTGGGDCLVIPGAVKGDDAPAAMIGDPVNQQYCGSLMGLQTIAGAVIASKTICSTQTPFRIAFNSDNVEFSAADHESTGGNTGFKIRYWQTTC